MVNKLESKNLLLVPPLPPPNPIFVAHPTEIDKRRWENYRTKWGAVADRFDKVKREGKLDDYRLGTAVSLGEYENYL